LLDSAADLVARARERFAVRDYHGAVLLLNEAVVEGVAYADAQNMLGLSLALVGRQTEAVAAFDAALALNPRYVEAHLNRAVLLNDMGRMEEARQAFETAQHLGKPDETGFPVMVANRLANAHAALAFDYRAAGALDESVAQYQRALHLRPGYADVRLALARAEQLDEVLRIRPDWLDAMLLRGLTAYLQDDLAGADRVWTAAAERHPEEPRVEIYRSMLARRRDAAQ
jgi:tetratricopeptide (TPR) repeat protein